MMYEKYWVGNFLLYESDVSFHGFYTYGLGTFRESVGNPIYMTKENGDYNLKLSNTRDVLAKLYYAKSYPFIMNIVPYNDLVSDFKEVGVPYIDCAIDDFLKGKNKHGESPVPMGFGRMKKKIKEQSLEAALE